MARTRTVTKQVKFGGKTIPATYSQNRDGSFRVALGDVGARSTTYIEIPNLPGSGRGRFERAGYASIVGKWESARFPTPQQALAAACKMLRSNG